ncbi:hypothetical protein JYU34_020052 [Plutella xylostella]|uniref:Uncharacterized protein n=1 Tax=Plutella xylostella TaxID=51655 RepID=A0ABQ7PVV0_PLUXY|nr:hypothetical protein JYU34_020052 [Plutella xylostella]
MRRWPMYAFVLFCVLLLLLLVNNWRLEGALKGRIGEMSLQMQDCLHKMSACKTKNIALAEDNEITKTKVHDLRRIKRELDTELEYYNQTVTDYLLKIDLAEDDFAKCKNELESLKSTELSKSVLLETLRLERDNLLDKLTEMKNKILELQNEIVRLKLSSNNNEIAVTNNASTAVALKDSSISICVTSPAIHNSSHSKMFYNESMITTNDTTPFYISLQV